ncbi:hypothetical protein TeGR_g11008 [Tetraparma gracilis]|uniref:LisH domain-containing protein n=1 Tax=Tetraparma gracilis TaxID=2962635 RepID=A0ABQ6MWJ5_9STRA|nr:hypothetical protein TeGR_g11008 [Tetraparma gracilis]
MFVSPSPASALSFIASFLLHNRFYLTALELHSELHTSNLDPPALSLLSSAFTSPLFTSSLASLPPASPLFTAPFGENSISSAFTSRDERISLLEHDNRCLKEDLEALQSLPPPAPSPAPALTPASTSSHRTPSTPSFPTPSTPAPPPLSPSHSAALTSLVKAYLQSNNYRLTAATFSSELPPSLLPPSPSPSSPPPPPDLLENLFAASLLAPTRHATAEEVAELASSNASLASSNASLTSSNDALASSNADLNSANASLVTKNAALEAELLELRQKVATLESDLSASSSAPSSDASSTMAATLASSLPPLCSLLPAPSRLPSLGPLLSEALLHCPRQSQQKNLSLGLLLLLKRPQKAQREQILSHLITASASWSPDTIKNVILDQSLELAHTHNIDEIRLLSLSVCVRFGPGQPASFISSSMLPVFQALTDPACSAVVRKAVISAYPSLLLGGSVQEHWEFLRKALRQDTPEMQTCTRKLLSATLSHYADTDMSQVWSLLALYQTSLQESAAPPTDHAFFFSACSALQNLLPFIVELMDEEEQNLKVEDVVTGRLASEGESPSISSWPGFSFLTSLLHTAVGLIASKPPFPVAGALDCSAALLRTLCSELGKEYTQTITLVVVVAKLGVKLGDVIGGGVCPILDAGAEDRDARFARLRAVLGGPGETDVLRAILGEAGRAELDMEPSQVITLPSLPSHIVTSRLNNGRTVSVNSAASGSGLLPGDVVVQVGEGGGVSALRHRVAQGVRDDLLPVFLEVVVPCLGSAAQKGVLGKVVEATATAALPFDWSAVVAGLGKMCARSSGADNADKVVPSYLSVLFEASMLPDARVKAYAAVLLGGAARFVEREQVRGTVAPALLSLAHASQAEGVQVAAARVALNVLVDCTDPVAERALMGRVREYATRSAPFDLVSVALVDGLNAGVLSVGTSGRKADFWVACVCSLAGRACAPAQGGGGATRAVAKGLVACFAAFCQIGMVAVAGGGGGERREECLRGMRMLGSARAAGTREALVLEKMVATLELGGGGEGGGRVGYNG